MKYEDYVPELNYPARNYLPFNGRENHFCTDCKLYYNRLFEEGKTVNPWPIKCTFDKRLDALRISRDSFDTDEDYEVAKKIADPVTWSFAELNIEPRWYQEEILNCTSQFKAVRAGRRSGKTYALSVLALWFAVTNENFEILVVCPYIAQVAKIFDNIRELLGKSPEVSNSVIKNTRGSPQEIFFANGSKIRGFAAGSGSGGNSDQIRGQDADLIIIDEVDYIADSDIEVIMAILSSNAQTRCIVSSTPTGIRSKLFEFCTDKDDNWKEFWYISPESKEWRPDIEAMYKGMYSAGGYSREFLAEFGQQMAGVFKATDLAKCVKAYDLSECRPNHEECTYTIGVDWNKTTGTHITVVERPKQGDIKYKLVQKVIIRKSEFTQHEAVEKIRELERIWNPAFIYVDAGYGHTQVEMLWKLQDIEPEKKWKKRVVPIEMGGNIEIMDPIDKVPIKKPAKSLMVYLAAIQVEKHRVIFPKSEDTATRIVLEEIPYSEIGIVQQARDFKVVKVSPAGRETFSQDYEHTLTAWMLAILANLLEFGDYRKITYTNQIIHVGNPDLKLSSVPDRDSMGNHYSPSQLRAMQNAAAIYEREKAEEERQLKEASNGSISQTTTHIVPTADSKTGHILLRKDGIPVAQIGRRIERRRFKGGQSRTRLPRSRGDNYDR